MVAVVLAGGPPDAVAATQPGAPNKAFVSIAGASLVERTLRALRASHSIHRIVVVAPPRTHALADLALSDERRSDGERITESLRSGLNGLPPDELVLICTSDLPVLTAEAVDDFVSHAGVLDPDLGYGCIERRVHSATYPQVPHTWAYLREGTFCGAGLIVMKPRAFSALERFIERLGAARKNPLALARIFGWDVMVRFAFRRLSIASAERRASQILGVRVCALVSPHAEAGVNVDRVSDVALAEALVSESSTS
jgi:GTP:adenosylcobinamide-phosphate guanylyltransferase